jgi:proteasome lid subunit RPN8/RPN11
MITLNTIQQDKIREETLRCFPNEMCGILVEDNFIPLVNISESPEDSFRFDASELVLYAGMITAIVHSHCRNVKNPELLDTRTPSVTDIINQKKTNTPWIIVATEGYTVTEPLEFPKIPSNEYIGRPFIWFVNDCYSIVQDWYKFELDIILPDHKAVVDYRDLNGEDELFTEYLTEYKFTKVVQIEDIQDGDILLLNYRGRIRNHLGIYINGEVLHQDMLSVKVPFSSMITKVDRILRYVS